MCLLSICEFRGDLEVEKEEDIMFGKFWRPLLRVVRVFCLGNLFLVVLLVIYMFI